MKNIFKNLLLSLSIKVAVICVIATHAIAMYIGPEHGILWRFQILILLPAFYVGALVSGNMHAPNVLVSYVVLFVIYLIIAAGLIILSRFVYKQVVRIRRLESKSK